MMQIPKGILITVIVLTFFISSTSTLWSNNTSIHNSNNQPPIGLKAVVLTDTSANLSWLSVNSPQETQWDLELIRKGNTFTGIPTHIGITANPFNIDTLGPGVFYEFRVRAICAGVAGSWSTTGTFFTHILNKSGCGIDLEIPDTDCLTGNASIQVRNEPGTSLGSDVILQEIKLIIEHDWLIDLEIWLKSPTGITVQLIDENGGTLNDFGDPSDLTCQNSMSLLNAVACNEIPLSAAGPPYDKRYLPIGNLNAFNDGSNPNGVWELIICDDAPTNIGSLKFIELVFEPANCTKPTGLVAAQIDSTSIQLNWAPGGFCATTTVEYGFPGFTLGSGTQKMAGCPPYTLTGLQGGTEYEIYIFEDCGSGNFEYACESIVVETDCAPPPVTVYSDFDNQNTCFGTFCTSTCNIQNDFWQNARNDEIDWTVYQLGTPTSGTGPTTDASGSGNYIYLESSSFFGLCAAGSEAVLISSCMTVDTKNTDTCHVGFKYHMDGVFINNLKFQITTDGVNWVTLWSESGDQGSQWQEARVSLSSYNGQSAQFRFVGTRGNGSLGDIALDEIAFYGSTINATPPFIFYVDNDGDGFGDSNNFIQQCFDVQPIGYVDNNLDCNDSNPNVALNSPEIPCNGIDENCNGNFDDFILPPPNVPGPINLCEGEIDTLIATPNFGGTITWYDTNFFVLAVNDTLIVNNLQAMNGNQTLYQFYALEDVGGQCSSVNPGIVEVVVNTLPNISTADEPVICRGESFDLSTVQVSDQNNTIGTRAFYTSYPPNNSNVILPPEIITPIASTDYFIRKITNGGCEDSTMVRLEVLPSPVATITPNQDTLQLCRGESRLLTGNASGGIGGYNQIWSNLQTSSVVFVGSGATNGAENLMTFTVTDQNQCSDTDSILIRTVTSINNINRTITPVSFCFGNDGSIALNPSDGTPNYNYAWNGPISGSANSSGGYTISNLTQGSYSITITDSSPEGCEFVLNNIIVDGPSANISIDSIRPISCFGENDGGIFTTVSGNNPTITWSPNTSNNDDVIDLSAGLYNVTVSEGTCETVITDIEVPQPDSLFALSNPEDVSCFNESDGKINVSVFGGKPNYNFSWNHNSINQNPTNLSTGSYWFTLTDTNGCIFESDTVTIGEPTDISIAINYQINPLCTGDSNGEIEVIASGGIPPYQYTWNDNGVGKTRSGLPAGTYEVNVVDANGCLKRMTPIILTDPNPIEMSRAPFITSAPCFGIDGGAIDINVIGGSGTYNYRWNNSQNTQDISGISAGDYWVTISDSNGCSIVTDTITVTAPESLDVDFNLTNPTCVGRADGAIDLQINSGGTTPFSYAWNTNDTIQDLNNIELGNYEVTITHSNGCLSIFKDIEVTANQILNGNNVASFSPSCHGESTGRIFSNIDDGQRPYSYNWSNSMSSQNLIDIPSGMYALTVTDANNCILEIDSIEIVDNDSLVVEILTLDEVSCHNDTTGGISIQVSGGVPNYGLMWNGGMFTTATISNLSPGNYDLTVTDAANCNVEFPTIVLKNPPKIQSDFQVCLDPDCSGGLNRDTIKLFTSGGVPPLTNMWSNGASSNQLVNINSGEYDVTITDAVGCVDTIENIKVPATSSSFFFTNYEKEDVSCFGAEDGSIGISFEGGTAPFQYSWSDGAGNGDITMSDSITLTNEEKGTYVLTVVDNNGCVIESLPVDILEPERITFEIINTEDVDCFGGSNGVITSQTIGGNPPYIYQWLDANSNFITANNSSNAFPAGEYYLSVTDNNGCSEILDNPVIINQPDSFYVELKDIVHVGCMGDSTGSLEIEVHGGNPGYFIDWADGSNDYLRDSLPAGNYSVLVKDAKNCIEPNNSFTISQPLSRMNFASMQTMGPVCDGENSGTIDFNVTGGNPPYVYFRDGILLDSSIANNLYAGTYRIQVRDSNMCLIDTNLTIVNPLPMSLTFTGTPVTPNVWNDGTVTVNPNGGVPPYSYNWNTGDTTSSISNLTMGFYFVTITDSLGCSKEDAYNLQVSSSTETLEINGEISLAPNPTNGLIQVRFELNTFENFKYQIINQQGKLLDKNQVDVPNKTTLPIDLRAFPNGIYYFTLQKENAWKTWKIIKQ